MRIPQRVREFLLRLSETEGSSGPWLRRSFWQPLRRMMDMFHIMPLTAALVIFVLLATVGQLREIYIASLERLGAPFTIGAAAMFAFAAFGLALISAVLFEAHYLLSTMRLNVIYSSSSNPDARSMLRTLQQTAAVILALFPWFGLLVGLYLARDVLNHVFSRLPHDGSVDLGLIEHVPVPGSWSIMLGLVVIGLVMAAIAGARWQSRILPFAFIIATVPMAAFVFLLLANDIPATLGTATLDTGIVAAIAALFCIGCYGLQVLARRLVCDYAAARKTGVNLRRIQRWLVFVWVLAPWIVIAVYFGALPPPMPDNAQHSWAMIPVAMCWVAAMGLAVAFLLHRFRESRWLQNGIYCSVAVLAFAGLVISVVASPHAVVTVYRGIGPLASMALGLLFILSTFVVLGLLSTRSGFPALTLVTLALVISILFPIPIGWTVTGFTIACAVFFVSALWARLWWVALVALVLILPGAANLLELRRLATEVGPNKPDAAPNVQQAFGSWLDSRKLGATGAGAANTDGYPVFIVAVEGGGIYAASAASLLLAKLEDADPRFAEHVFAISAVSGGAIGATIFQVLDRSANEEDSKRATTLPNKPAIPADCRPIYSDKNLTIKNSVFTDKVCAIMESDYFSPVVATTYPELLGFSSADRADVLAASFEDSTTGMDPCAGADLGQPFAADWTDQSRAPALVLNSTWVETGARMAFAPFPLHAIDDSLFSFADKDMPRVGWGVSKTCDSGLQDKTAGNSHSQARAAENSPLQRIGRLIYAAVVSARFPGILPPFSVAFGGEGPRRWNFVDGGYADSSGAATALALFKALRPIAIGRHADLSLILVTSSNPQFDPQNIKGTSFADTIAPVDALLQVRADLGHEAVAHACDGVSEYEVNQNQSASSKDVPASTCDRYSNGPQSHLLIVKIADQTYELPLGWILSHTTLDVVRWMLGEVDSERPTSCDVPPKKQTVDTTAASSPLDAEIARDNTCVLSTIRQRLADWEGRQ
jgi:hypothetical protein